MSNTIVLIPRPERRQPNKPIFDVDIRDEFGRRIITVGAVQQVIASRKWFFNRGLMSVDRRRQGPYDDRLAAISNLVQVELGDAQDRVERYSRHADLLRSIIGSAVRMEPNPWM